MRFEVLHTDTPAHVELGVEAEMPAEAYYLAQQYERAGARNVQIRDTKTDPHTLLNWQEFARAHGLDS
ncbi:MAG: hypothetical protein ABWZ40_08595 [Caulobacterales bacterium]